MKKLILFILLSNYLISFSQVSGNINYLNNVKYKNSIHHINFNFSNPNEINFEVKALSNLKADSYVAIFNVTQTGRNSEEASMLLDNRLKEIINYVAKKPEITMYIDMVSFVPKYEYIVEKKLFSKNTYNEVPKGFELQKNIHIKYKNASVLHDLIQICSKSEIFDLVKVDYYIENLEDKKNELLQKARKLIQQKIGDYQVLLDENFGNTTKRMVDGFAVKYPIEMYNKFQSYSSSSLHLKPKEKHNAMDKTTKMYYQPIMDKDFDFTINAPIIEPVIQLLYQIKIKVIPKKEELVKKPTQYILITPNGDLRKIPLQ